MSFTKLTTTSMSAVLSAFEASLGQTGEVYAYAVVQVEQPTIDQAIIYYRAEDVVTEVNDWEPGDLEIAVKVQRIGAPFVSFDKLPWQSFEEASPGFVVTT